jgi:exopolyphosphatase/guanosine-5'-triphosphate,3'-diphosphate pyrophosphatase
MTRVAAIDCGTNSIRLLIADVDGQGNLRDVARELELVRLGEGVDRTGRFSAAALERTLEATRGYARQIRDHGAERIRFVATSATRDAANRDEFADAVQKILGASVEVISGTEEAALSYRGALTALAPADADDLSVRHLVVDLGGGSTELVLGTQSPDAAFSMDVGCVRLTERHVHGDPLSDGEIASIRRDVATALDTASTAVDIAAATDLIGVAGTVTTITAHALRLSFYDPLAINGARLPIADMLRACDEISRMTRSDRGALPFMHPGRVDVIQTGAVIWSTIVQRIADATAAAGAPLTVVTTSEHDILDGVALSLVLPLAGT